jgi:hypothetical protein
VTVEAVTRLEDAELTPDVLARMPMHIGTVMLILVGGDVPRFERLSRNEIAVFLPVARAMHDVWNTALDLPIGEARAIDTAEPDPEPAVGRPGRSRPARSEAM